MTIELRLKLRDGKTTLEISGAFVERRDLIHAVVRAVFNHFIESGVATTRAYWLTAEECGYDTPSTIQRIIANP